MVHQANSSQMQEMFGVGERAQQEWFARSERAWTALKSTSELVMHRELRAKAMDVCGIVSEIVRNCQADKNDIRLEVAFPVLIERITTALEEYLKTSSVTSFASPPTRKLTDTLQLLNEADAGLRNLLQNMQGNDTSDLSQLTTSMSAVFRRYPVAEERRSGQ